MLGMNEKKLKLRNKINKHKERNKRAMYLLYLLHFKGYPVSELYENEIKDVSLDMIISFHSDESSIIDDSINEDEGGNEQINHKKILKKPRKHWFDSILNLDDYLFVSRKSSKGLLIGSEKKGIIGQKKEKPKRPTKEHEVYMNSRNALQNPESDHLASSIMKFGNRKARDSGKFFNPFSTEGH